MDEVVKNYIGQTWTDDLKKLISKLALKFMVDNSCPDETTFAVVLERRTGIGGDMFRGMKIIS